MTGKIRTGRGEPEPKRRTREMSKGLGKPQLKGIKLMQPRLKGLTGQLKQPKQKSRTGQLKETGPIEFRKGHEIHAA